VRTVFVVIALARVMIQVKFAIGSAVKSEALPVRRLFLRGLYIPSVRHSEHHP
jgi:hypothetical protein